MFNFLKHINYGVPTRQTKENKELIISLNEQNHLDNILPKKIKTYFPPHK